jgi:hypothetical protein
MDSTIYPLPKTFLLKILGASSIVQLVVWHGYNQSLEQRKLIPNDTKTVGRKPVWDAGFGNLLSQMTVIV